MIFVLIAHLQRSVHCDHLVIVIRIKENVIDVMLSCGSCYNRRSTIPMNSDVPATEKKIINSNQKTIRKDLMEVIEKQQRKEKCYDSRSPIFINWGGCFL